MKPYLSFQGPCVRRGAVTLVLVAAAVLPVGCSSAPAAKTAPEPAGAAEAPEAEAAETPQPQPQPAPQPRSMGEALEELYAEAEPPPRPEESEEKEWSIDYPAPPDGKWLVDEEGKEYFVVEVPKERLLYRRLDETTVRLRYGNIVHLAGETDEVFLVKVYKVEPVERRPAGPSPEQVAEVEALYRPVELAVVDGPELRPFDAGLPRQGNWRNGFDVADMNGDGHPDIVHGPPRRGFVGRPVIFLGDGAGTWRHWEEATFPEGPWDYGDAEAADFNGDGAMDMALGVHLGGLAVLVGDGQGGFSRWDEGLTLVPAGQPSPDFFASRAVASTDWDGDGLPDLVALSEGPRHPKATERDQTENPPGLVIFHNQGDGSWNELRRLGAGVDLFGDSVTVADFDGDGRSDLASGSNALGPRTIVFLNRGEDARALEVEAVRPLSLVWSVDAADFDGDGLADLAVASSGFRVEEWWSALDVLFARKGEDGELSFERRTLTAGREAPELQVSAVGAGDVDGDGHADLVTATREGVVTVYLGDGRGGLVRREGTLTEPAAGCRGYHVRLADLDGDGAEEIVAAFAGEKCPGEGSLRAWKSAAR